MTREEAILRLRVQREQAAEVLEKFQKGIYGHGGKVGVAIDTAIAALRDCPENCAECGTDADGMRRASE